MAGAGLLLLAVAGLSAFSLHQQQYEASTLLSESMTKIQAAEEILVLNEEMLIVTSQFLLSSDRGQREEIPPLKADARRWLERAGSLVSSPEEQKLLVQIRSGQERLFQALDDALRDPVDAFTGNNFIDRLRALNAQAIVGPVDAYRQFNQQRIAAASIESERLADRLGLLLLLLGVCGAVAGVLLGAALAHSVHRQVEERERAMMRSERLATMGRLAAGLAHELRNPLTAMKIVVQSATERADGHVLDRGDFRVLVEEIDRLNDSIQTFLDYARPPRPQKRPCLVRSLVEQTVALVAHRAEQAGVTIQLDMPDDLVYLEADPPQLRQVLLNLLLNALDASTAESRLTVRMSRSVEPSSASEGPGHPPAGCVVIEVEDQGCGLPAELGEGIFEPFVSNKETGTGLGLAISRYLVEAHGGTLTAHNHADGALFRICLPAESGTPADDRDASAMGNPPAGTTT